MAATSRRNAQPAPQTPNLTLEAPPEADFSRIPTPEGWAETRLAFAGVTDLLCHNGAAMIQEMTGKTRRGPVQIPEPEEEAERGAYKMPDSSFGLPGQAMRGSYLSAAPQWKLKGRLTLARQAAHTLVAEEWLQLYHRDGEPIRDYVIDRRRVVIKGVGAVLRSRPRFRDWAGYFTVLYDPDLVTEEQLRNVAIDAGKRIGVGDGRPFVRNSTSPGLGFGLYNIVPWRVFREYHGRGVPPSAYDDDSEPAPPTLRPV